MESSFSNRASTEVMMHTENFSHVTWMGQPIWQNIFDIWCCQEIIARVRPRWIIETGTNRGGSALFFANLCDLLGHGEVITIDTEQLHTLAHPRITFLHGSSTSPEISDQVRSIIGRDSGTVFVTLDSNHHKDHVCAELALYADLVTPSSYLVVQDTCIDTLEYLTVHRPGPLGAVREFLQHNPDFSVCPEFDGKYLISHHPSGYLKRAPAAETSKLT